MNEEKTMILDVDESPKRIRDWLVLSLQHVLAMFVACISVPLLVFAASISVPEGYANAGEIVSYVNANGQALADTMIAPTLVAAGVGTLFYIFLTKMKSPVFLASSFAYIAPMSSALLLGAEPVMATSTGLAIATEGSLVVGYFANLWALPIGMSVVGLIYVIVAILIRFVGVGWLERLLPTIVIGPVIMVIGLGLSSSAIANLEAASGSGDSYNLLAILCGLFAMAVTAVCAHYGKKGIALIPFVLGMLGGYLLAAVLTLIGYYGCGNSYFHIVDFSPLVDNFSEIGVSSFINLPSFLFLPENFQASVSLTPSHLWSILLLFGPVSLVTICEHIGDHKNLSGILRCDLLEDPGLARTLAGDGIATALSGFLCGAANTTYGENVAVVGVTKIASVKVIILACLVTIALGFLSPLMALIQTIPTCVTGGVSLLLYGFIASSGVKMLISERIDFGKTRNIFIASLILVSGIGGLAISFAVGDAQISVTSTAVSMILGILANQLLKEKQDAAEPTSAE